MFLLISRSDRRDFPMFDTAALHVKRSVEIAFDHKPDPSNGTPAMRLYRFAQRPHASVCLAEGWSFQGHLIRSAA
jgi:hypothetical protein